MPHSSHRPLLPLNHPLRTPLLVTNNNKQKGSTRGGCVVPSCKVTECPQWGNGPDGMYTLCTKCYRLYLSMQLPLYQDVRNLNSVSAKPATYRKRVKIVGFKNKKTLGGRKRDLSRPVVTDDEESGFEIEIQKGRLRTGLKRARDRNEGSCLRCGTAESKRWCDGVDGAGTLCLTCFKQYLEMKVVLYRRVGGVLSANGNKGGDFCRVVGFEKGAGEYDSMRPVVVRLTKSKKDLEFADRNKIRRDKVGKKRRKREEKEKIKWEKKKSGQKMIKAKATNGEEKEREEVIAKGKDDICLRVEYCGKKRECRIAQSTGFEKLRKILGDLLNVADIEHLEITYSDEEGQSTKLDSQRDMDELLEVAHQFGGNNMVDVQVILTISLI